LPSQSPDEFPVMDRSRRDFLISLFLVALTALVFGQVCIHDYEFFNVDDSEYVLNNPQVQAGLTGPSLLWALTAFHAHNMHPLTWISLQLDCQIYGSEPWGFHLTNVLFHMANTVLVYLVFHRMTGAVWRSAVLAAFFAVHPFRIESVVWVAERK